MRSLAARLLLIATIWSGLVLAGGGLVLSAVFREAIESSLDARLAAGLESLIAATELQSGGEPALVTRKSPAASAGGGPSQGSAPEVMDPRYGRVYSGWYWQVRGPRTALLRSRSLWDTELHWPSEPAGAGRSREAETFYTDGPMGKRLRVMGRAIALPGATGPVQFAVAASTETMRAEQARFDRILAGALAVLGLGVVTAVLVQVRLGLRPLRAVQLDLQAIRAGKRARLEEDVPREIAPLVAELNALIEHSRQVVERARTHVGNLAHGLKTPLAILRNSLRGLDSATAHGLSDQIDLMQAQIDHYLARARTGGPSGLGRGRIRVADVVDDLLRVLTKLYHERGIVARAEIPAELTFAGDREDLYELLGALLDNAFKWARRAVEVAGHRTGPEPGAGADPNRLELLITDDGPGLAPERRALALQRGLRLDETVPGSGLGLSIAYEIVSLYAGSLDLERAATGGVRIRLRLPGAVPEDIPGS